MPDLLQVITAVPDRSSADKIAGLVVEKRLAACAQVIGPITSTYWWEGKIETAAEWLCLIKTTRRCYDPLEQAIRGVHPYQVAEIVALPLVAGSASYLAWVDAEVSGH